MTQKANLFKGQQKKKSVPPNRHGKPSVTRKGNYLALHVCVFCLWKIPVLDSMCICFCFFFVLVCAGKRFVKPAKVTKEMDVDRVCPIFYSLSKYYFYFFFLQIFRGFFMLGMLWFRLMGYVIWKCKWGQLNFVVIYSYEVGLSKSAY